MGVVVLLAFGWAVSVYGRPVRFAAAFALLTFLLGLLSADAAQSAITALVNLGFATAYFYLIARYSSNVLVYLLILFVGALAWVILPIWLAASGLGAA
ncbi:hypothetical protein KEM63_13550 [Halopseudomonas nanhaiensis]|uniref:hypothetical protein n=1 Tax=Halopseudomonas nanhaiensis TaxID=2830842 RepID=UPI001CBAB408|nr:hypothetical protein [Halopseudomonas nanhaiensis]UAW97811.1 hypothetical protein KEM63_13550 [Halopseudomonas nanhaiensis]